MKLRYCAKALAMSLLASLMLTTYAGSSEVELVEEPPIMVVELETVDPLKEPLITVVELESVEAFEVEVDILEPEPEIHLTAEELELVALVTVAEAEGESEEGQRLVIDTIFNRMESEHFPNTIHDVIYQPSQFEAMWNGRVDRCYVTDDIRQLVKEEATSRTNYDTVFFNAGGYSKYGKPMFQVGNHYFSSYK